MGCPLCDRHRAGPCGQSCGNEHPLQVPRLRAETGNWGIQVHGVQGYQSGLGVQDPYLSANSSLPFTGYLTGGKSLPSLSPCSHVPARMVNKLYLMGLPGDCASVR